MSRYRDPENVIWLAIAAIIALAVLI